MSETRRRLDEAAARRAQASLDTLRRLVAAGERGEAGVQDEVAALLTDLGCAIERVTYAPAEVPMVREFAAPTAIPAETRTCIVARKPGRGGGRSLIFFAHPDCEPVRDTDRWTHDPFTATLVEGRLHGWGVADDLAGVAVMIEALAVLREAGLAPEGEVILASTPSKRHARGVSALLHRGLSADAAVYLHPAESGAGMSEVKAFASGQLEFRLHVSGREPPTSEPLQTAFAHQAVNAGEKAMLLHAALAALDGERAARIRHPLLDAAVGRSTNLMLSFLAAGEPGALARSATTCTLGYALSFPPGEDLEAVQREVETAVSMACAGDPWLAEHPARVEWVSGTSGAEVPASHALFRAVAEAVREGTGRGPFVNPMHTGSDIRNPIVQKGIPTVGLGPLCGDLAQNGAVDEWVDAADYLRAVRVAAGIVPGWCGARPEVP